MLVSRMGLSSHGPRTGPSSCGAATLQALQVAEDETAARAAQAAALESTRSSGTGGGAGNGGWHTDESDDDGLRGMEAQWLNAYGNEADGPSTRDTVRYGAVRYGTVRLYGGVVGLAHR